MDKAGEQSAARKRETKILATALLEEDGRAGWIWAKMLADVPEEVGDYCLHEGIRPISMGVTYNMRTSLADALGWRGTIKRPIMMFKRDADGSSALWLEGKIRCSTCKQVIEISDEDKHNLEAHGIEAENECECR